MRRPESPPRGRKATSPLTIPPRGWWDVAMRLKDAVGRNHLSLTAAGVAFYSLLAVFPALAATVSLWGLLADPADIQTEIGSASALLPSEAGAIITDQARAIAETAGTGISFATAFGLAFALYSASKGVKSLMEGLNIIYGERERRGFVRLLLTALGLTVGGVCVAILAVGAVVVVPVAIEALGLQGPAGADISLLRWPIMALVVLFALAVVYRIAPCRRQARWQWVSAGAVLATALWIAASLGFSFYVGHFANYNETYGALGGVIILLMWLWLSAFAVLLGAELNAELEHQTAVDSTLAEPRPLGERGAHMADTVGERA
ncbi:MAG: YihY/virulence factor BrkB family protein [Acuticoccus sp.]